MGLAQASHPRHVTVAKNFNTRAILAYIAHESLPRSQLADPNPTAYTSCIPRLLQSSPHISDIHPHAAVIHNKITGLSTAVVTFSPSLLANGTVDMIQVAQP